MADRWRDYIDILETSEAINEGSHLTFRNGSNFLKSYSQERNSFPNWFFATYKFLFDRELPQEPTDEEKVSKEFELLQKQENIGLNAPHPIFQEEDFIESEFIPGESLRAEIEDDVSDINKVLKELGSMIKNLHDSGYARWDNRTINIIVDRTEWNDEPVPYLIDNEYLITDATEADQDLDLVSFIDSINAEDPYKFDEIYSGFRDGYGNIPSRSIALAGLRTFSEEILHQNFDKAYNSLKNTISGFQLNHTESKYQEQSSSHNLTGTPAKE